MDFFREAIAKTLTERTHESLTSISIEDARDLVRSVSQFVAFGAMASAAAFYAIGWLGVLIVVCLGFMIIAAGKVQLTISGLLSTDASLVAVGAIGRAQANQAERDAEHEVAQVEASKERRMANE